METEKLKILKEKCANKKSTNSSMSCLYGMGMFGAAIYFLSTATSIGGGVLGLIKSLVWPGVLVYEVFSKLGL